MSHRSKDLTLVLLQGLLFGLFLWSPVRWELDIAPASGAFSILLLALSIGGGLVVGLSILQMSTSLSPFPTPKKEGQLIDSGLFRSVRHPIYTGIILSTASWSVYSNNGWQLMVAGGLYLLFHFKSRYEEELLLGGEEAATTLVASPAAIAGANDPIDEPLSKSLEYQFERLAVPSDSQFAAASTSVN